jgi:hypothetical protein
MVEAMKLLFRVLAVGLAGVCALATPALAGGATQRPVVVELYTSQGCNTCPPADALLGKLAQRPDVIALSLPVTYWDMLGWKDTLASEANTRRQKAYAAEMGHGGVYTPQIIIDGVLDVIGSRQTNVELAIAQREVAIGQATAFAMANARTQKALADAARAAELASADAAGGVHAAAAAAAAARAQAAAAPMPVSMVPPVTPGAPPMPVDVSVPVNVVQNPNEMRIDIGAVPGQHNATVWMFHVRSQVSVNVAAGENAGHTITYHNVVADLRAVGLFKGQSLTLTLPRSAMAGLPHDGVAIVVQQGGYGHVLGASYLTRPAYYPAR